MVPVSLLVIMSSKRLGNEIETWSIIPLTTWKKNVEIKQKQIIAKVLEFLNQSPPSFLLFIEYRSCRAYKRIYTCAK